MSPHALQHACLATGLSVLLALGCAEAELPATQQASCEQVLVSQDPLAFVALYDRTLDGGEPGLLRALTASEGLVANESRGFPLRLQGFAGSVERYAQASGPSGYRSSRHQVTSGPRGHLLVRSWVVSEREPQQAALRTLALRPGGSCGFIIDAEVWRPQDQP